VGLEEESINQVGPGIGSDTIQKGIRAILLAGVVVLVFMALYYLGSGIVANFALCLNLALILAAMNLLSATMTLPGIAGILLTVGMAVDANILIFERIREEKGKGKTLHQALKTGYERAAITIIDANVTTLITAAILWLVGTGPVRGFAVTLSIGILASMFTAIFVTRVIFELLLMGRAITQFRMFQIVKDPNFGFVRWASMAIFASALFLAAGLLVFSYRGEKNLGIDFREGTVVDFNLKKAIPISEVRKRVTEHTRQTDTGTLYPYRTAEIQELWRGVEVAEKSVAHSFEVRTGWAEKPETVRGDLLQIFSGDLVPGPFENAQGVENVTNRSFKFTLFYNLTEEKNLKPMRAAFLRSFQNYLPEAFGEKRDVLPGTLSGSGKEDVGKEIAVKKVKFESKRIRADWNLAEIQAQMDKFVISIRADLQGQVECEFEGDFPYDPPQFERFADLALTLQFIKDVKPEEVHEAFKNFPAVKITPPKTGGPARAFVLQTEDFRQEGGDTADPWAEQLGVWRERVREAIRDETISSNLSEPISRSVGISPIVAGELVEKGILAIIFSLAAIVLYVAIRFQVGSTAQQFQGSGLFNLIKEILYRARYGIAAIAALVHDVFFTMGVLAICGTLGIIDVKIDLQILAAFLTIIGYSLNDTIVVFDRIRENLNVGEKMPFRDLVNHSINQTLGRTLLTSGTTFVVVFSLFLFGGGIIHGFSFTLLIGVIVGTYSSIYVASPVLLFWEKVVRPTSG
ncbi:MAG: protein translocase subunit SecF, partial [Planctomycetota bacterium]|jgi:SecD/SecF fusion protein